MDMEPQTEVLEFSAVELGSVIGDNSMRETKPADNVAYYEIDYFLHRDCCKRFSFSLFGEVINCDDGVLRTTFG